MSWKPGDWYEQYRPIIKLAFKVQEYKLTKGKIDGLFLLKSFLFIALQSNGILYVIKILQYSNKYDVTYSVLNESDIYILKFIALLI